MPCGVATEAVTRAVFANWFSLEANRCHIAANSLSIVANYLNLFLTKLAAFFNPVQYYLLITSEYRILKICYTTKQSKGYLAWAVN